MNKDPSFLRQLGFFDPEDFKKEIHIVGCGAIGSHIGHWIAKGVTQKNIFLYDGDVVEDHNLPNQMFRKGDIGQPKTEALARILYDYGADAVVKTKMVSELKLESPSYVFLCVDSMSARKSIWDSLLYNIYTRVLEVRMDAEYGFIRALYPTSREDIEHWEKSWFPDAEAEESACTYRAVATTAGVLSAVAVHYMIQWEKGDKPPKCTQVSLAPPLVSVMEE
jgi:molybdopterin/thiamine biosynthesis adenylyltransferase